MKFYSPYQFINIRPTKTKISYENRKKLKEVENKYVRHDYWAKDGLSGTINCTLTTQSPLVVGARQEPATKEKAGFVHQYTQPDGKIAIPANSLRGMIGSLAENISQSSLRILSKKSESIYSVRQTAQAGKKVALLLKDTTNGDFKLHKLKDSNGNDSTARMLKRSDVRKYDCRPYQHKKADIPKFY